MPDHGLLLRAASLAETHEIAAALAELARPGDIIVLSGEMGAGKTAFAQGFGRALGVTEPITSPTFTLVHSYDVAGGAHGGKLTLHHADLYRLEHTTEVIDLALGELAEFRGIVLVEWGDVVDALFGDHLVVRLAPDDESDEHGGDADDGDAGDGDAGDGGADADFGLDTGRLVEIVPVGGSWAGRWDRVVDATRRFAC